MQIFLFIILCLILIFIFLKVISTFISLFYGSPSGETASRLAQEIFTKIGLKKNQTLYELGSGYGNVGMVAAKDFSTQVVGFEVSPLPFLVSKIRSLFVKNFQVRCKNILNIDLKKADVVYCFLMPELLAKLTPKFKKELSKGTIVISLIFKILDLKIYKILKIKNKKIYIYKF